MQRIVTHDPFLSPIRVLLLTLLFIPLSGCEQLQKWFQGEEPAKPVPVTIPTPQPQQVVDQATFDVIEKRKAAVRIVQGFQRAQPIDRTDEFMKQLAEVPEEEFTFINLDLSGTPVTDVGLQLIARMPRVESLNLSRVSFTSAPLVSLRELPKLRKLTLSKAQFPGTPCLAEIGQLPYLEELWLDETLIVDDDLAGLRGMPNLRELHLDRTRLTDAAFQHLALLPQLEVLTISQTNITSKGLKTLCGVTDSRLRVLDVHQTYAGQNGFAALDGLGALEELDASESQVTDQSLRGWKSPPNLKRLVLARNSFTNVSLPGILGTPSLEELHLQRVVGVNDTGLNHIVRKKSLRLVYLDNSGVTSQGARQLKQIMPSTKVGFDGAVH